jgi:hypothetical protein
MFKSNKVNDEEVMTYFYDLKLDVITLNGFVFLSVCIHDVYINIFTTVRNKVKNFRKTCEYLHVEEYI